MRFTVSQPALAGAISAPARIANTRATAQAIGSVFVEAVENALVVTGTDADTVVKTAIEATVEATGRALIPARRLQDAVRLLEGDITFELAGDRIKVVSGRFSGSVRTLPIGNFPTFEEPKGDSVNVRSQLLQEALEQVLPACSTDEKHPMLMGVRVEVRDHVMRLIGTDAIRIAIKEIPCMPRGEADLTAVLPRAALEEAADTRFPGVEFLFDGGQVTLRAPKLIITTRAISGKYPAYEKFLPTVAERSVGFERQALIHAVKRVRIFAEDIAPLDILLHEGTATFTCDKSQEVLESYGSNGDGPYRFAVHPGYLLDGLEALEGDGATLYLNEPNRPIKMEAGGFTYVLMPVRVR